jgi:hypothetical protein
MDLMEPRKILEKPEPLRSSTWERPYESGGLLGMDDKITERIVPMTSTGVRSRDLA